MCAAWILSPYLEITESPDHSCVLIFSTLTGTLAALSNVSWDHLSQGRWHLLSAESLQVLRDAEILTQTPEHQFHKYRTLSYNKSRDSGVLSRFILPSAFCQLSCVYCGQKHHNHKMNEPTIEALVSSIRADLRRSKHTRLIVTWYGAEPLTAPDVISVISMRLTEICDEMGVVYEARVITNGLALQGAHSVKLLKEGRVSLLTVSIDGPRFIHDARRPTKDGHGTFDRILTNLVHLANCADLSKMRLRVRINIDPLNADYVPELIEDLAFLGLAHRMEVDLAIVVPWSRTYADLMERSSFAQREVSWLSHLIYRGFTVGLLPTPKPSSCLASDPNAYLITSDGMAHNCALTAHAPHAITSSTIPIGPLNAVTPASLRSRHDQIFNMLSAENSPCRTCTFLFTCQGGCPKEVDVGLLPCPSYRFNMRERMQLRWVISRLSENNQKGDVFHTAPPSVRDAVTAFSSFFPLFRLPVDFSPSETMGYQSANCCSTEASPLVAIYHSLSACYLRQLNPHLYSASREDQVGGMARVIAEAFVEWTTSRVLRHNPAEGLAYQKLIAIANRLCLEHFISLPTSSLIQYWNNASSVPTIAILPPAATGLRILN